MGRHVIKFEGLEELSDAMVRRTSLKAVQAAVKKNGAELQKKAQRNCNFRGHYEYQAGVGKIFVKPTGKLQGSIGLDIQDNGLSAVVEPVAEYAAYVELGTRKMEAQPYLKPAWNEQKEKFHRDMMRLVE